MQPSPLQGLPSPLLRRYAEARVPTDFGTFRVIVYRDQGDVEHLAIVRGEVSGSEEVLVRVHSECFTGEVLHSLKCDCRGQLDLALHRIAEAGRGVVVYLRQEGRGIGLGNKIKAYALQERGMDTVDANRALGFGDDLRRYDAAAEILSDLGVCSLVLMTNNPDKVRALLECGIDVVRRVSHQVPANEHNASYLYVKRARMGHLIDVESDGAFPSGE